jgi:integrase
MNIEKTGNSLRLRWWDEGKRCSLSLQLEDTPINRAYAKEIAARIERDQQAGYFDNTLLKYRPHAL